MVDIAKHRELEAKATRHSNKWSVEQAWRVEEGCRCLSCYEVIPGAYIVDNGDAATIRIDGDGDDAIGKPCAEYVAAALSDHAAMLDELEAARAVVAAAKELNSQREKNYYFEWNNLEDRCSEYDRAAKGEV